MSNFDFSEKGLGLISPAHSVNGFSKKNDMLCSINWPSFIVWLLIAFTSRDIGQYVYYNCLLTRLWRDKFEINLIFLIKPFCSMTKKSRQKFKYLENEKSFWCEIKSVFHFSFLKAFPLPKIISDLRVHLYAINYLFFRSSGAISSSKNFCSAETHNFFKVIKGKGRRTCLEK